jgi:transposase-like protein
MIEVKNMIINNVNSNQSEILNEGLFSKTKINYCPHCESMEFTKYGKFNNRQRYLCKECLRTFSETTNTPRYYSKKGPEHWEEYISIMFNYSSLRESAKEVNINLKTAFIWRHKILYALESMTKTKELKDSIEMRKLFIRENHKGNRTNIINEGRKVWVIASSDSNDETFAKPISLGFWNKRNFDKLVYSKINEDSYIRAFGDNYIKSVASKHNKDKVEKVSSNSKCLVNYFTANIKGIISSYHGVATKYLPHYFSLAKIISLAKEYNILDLLNNISTYNSYIPGENFKKILLPFQLI